MEVSWAGANLGKVGTNLISSFIRCVALPFSLLPTPWPWRVYPLSTQLGLVTESVHACVCPALVSFPSPLLYAHTPHHFENWSLAPNRPCYTFVFSKKTELTTPTPTTLGRVI